MISMWIEIDFLFERRVGVVSFGNFPLGIYLCCYVYTIQLDGILCLDVVLVHEYLEIKGGVVGVQISLEKLMFLFEVF